MMARIVMMTAAMGVAAVICRMLVLMLVLVAIAVELRARFTGGVAAAAARECAADHDDGVEQARLGC
jgi:hypothetical protein